MTVIRPPTRPQIGSPHSRENGSPWRDRGAGPITGGAARTEAGQSGPDGERADALPVLRLVDVHAFLDGAHVLRGVSLDVHAGEIVALLGANGAGKTTTLRTIHGFVRPRRGRIERRGRDVSHVPTHELVRRGVGQVPERHRVFRGMSVLENLEMGAYSRVDRTAVADDVDRVFAQFPRLAERRRQEASTLSGGEQQMLVIGRALMARPSVLLLDEPTADLAPILVEQVFATLREISTQGVAVLLVEQNVNAALGIAAWAYVLQTGRIVRSGRAQELVDDPDVRVAYLGD